MGSRDEPTPALEISGLRKVYGGTVALAGADVTVNRGEIHGLLGENGAGKSTLVKILAGLETPDGGRIELFGSDCPPGHPEVVARLGCAFIHQNVPLVGNLTIAENVALLAGFPRRLGLVDSGRMRAVARSALARVDMGWLDVDTVVDELPVATRAVVAIVRALSLDARLLVLDEPTAALQATEVEILFEILRRLRSEGVAIIFISHRIDEVLAVCDRVTVLRAGTASACEPTAGLTEERLVELILGQELAEVARSHRPARSRADSALLRLDGVCGAGVGPLDLEVQAGEIVGVTGLVDAGFAAIGGLVFGTEAPVSGTMQLAGADYAPRTPGDAIEAGVAFVPADRAGHGLAAAMRVFENLFLNPKRHHFRLLRRRSEVRAARVVIGRFDVRPHDPEREVWQLSGGNQQKLVLSRWLHHRPRVLVLHEPTAAVDIGARAELYRRLRAEADSGVAVIVLTSDFEEAVDVCDRVLVMRRGRIEAELAAENLEVSRVTRAAYGAGS